VDDRLRPGEIPRAARDARIRFPQAAGRLGAAGGVASGGPPRAVACGAGGDAPVERRRQARPDGGRRRQPPVRLQPLGAGSDCGQGVAGGRGRSAGVARADRQAASPSRRRFRQAPVPGGPGGGQGRRGDRLGGRGLGLGAAAAGRRRPARAARVALRVPARSHGDPPRRRAAHAEVQSLSGRGRKAGGLLPGHGRSRVPLQFRCAGPHGTRRARHARASAEAGPGHATGDRPHDVLLEMPPGGGLRPRRRDADRARPELGARGRADPARIPEALARQSQVHLALHGHAGELPAGGADGPGNLQGPQRRATRRGHGPLVRL